MIIIPSIDLYQQHCVRLEKGNFSRMTTYETSPETVLFNYRAQGAREVHLVDLEGAQSGAKSQRPVLVKLKSLTDLVFQVGGGLRTEEDIVELLEQGIDRAVVGTLAVQQPAVIQSLIRRYGVDRLVLALDVVEVANGVPIVAIKGWQETTARTLWQVLGQYADWEGLSVLCTDIHRDGMLAGPNLTLYEECVDQFPQFQFQASGGVTHEEEVLALQRIGLAAAIVGKALYENRMSLASVTRWLRAC